MSGTITLKGKAAHDFINFLQGANGHPHCDGDKHTAGCGHKDNPEGGSALDIPCPFCGEEARTQTHRARLRAWSKR